jgi:hypothetical protein
MFEKSIMQQNKPVGIPALSCADVNKLNPDKASPSSGKFKNLQKASFKIIFSWPRLDKNSQRNGRHVSVHDLCIIVLNIINKNRLKQIKLLLTEKISPE